jgi:hypothetical protein
MQSFNSNNTLLLMNETNGVSTPDLYDATTTPPTPINRITTTDGSFINSSAGDAVWSNTNPTRIYYIPWGENVYGGAGLQLRYVDVSGCTKSSCVVTPVTVHTFSCTADSYAPSPITPGTPCNVIESSYTGQQGGMSDLTDTYFSFSGDICNGNGCAEVDLFRYDLATDTVTTQEKWYKVCSGGVPSGCGVWSSYGRQGYAMFRMTQHPDSNYIAIVWLCQTISPTTPQVGCGTSAYGPTYNFLGFISLLNDHQDMGFDVNGVPVWVGTSGDEYNVAASWSLEVTDLTKLSTSAITSKEIELPCSTAYAGSPCPSGQNLQARFYHVSMTGTWGSVPGYALYSSGTQAGAYNGWNVDMPIATTLGTAVSSPGVATVTPGTMANIGVGTQQLIDHGGANVETVTVTAVTKSTFTATFAKTHTATALVSNLTVGDAGPYAVENIAVKIDTTAANGSTAQVWRLGRVMSIRDADYAAEAHTTVNRDWTAYVWGSNWNTDGGRVYGFWTKLPAAAPKASSASSSAKPE